MPPIPQVTVSPLALDTCRLIGANPAGPVGARLIEACGALPQQRTLATGAERDALVSMLIDGGTNRETYFFRDRRQLALMGALLRDAAPPGVPLTLWSAGCATGEEAYSLAIVLRELGLPAAVTGTDISRRALAAANAAHYRTGQMSPCREVKAEDETFLPSTPDGHRTVADPIRSAVRFLDHNILSGPPPQPQRFDAVVCRNVLIYMDAASRGAALLVLTNAVKPGGLLLLGPGDVAPPVDPVALGFRAVFRDGAGVFIKGDADGR
jgi:chemotaxis protein methyltransferase CheR